MKQCINSGCCTAVSDPNDPIRSVLGLHEHCNCKANVDFCKNVCDHDYNCKGYVATDTAHCHIATTSYCPETNACTKGQEGKSGNLNGSASCGDGFQGCFIKQPG